MGTRVWEDVLDFSRNAVDDVFTGAAGAVFYAGIQNTDSWVGNLPILFVLIFLLVVIRTILQIPTWVEQSEDLSEREGGESGE